MKLIEAIRAERKIRLAIVGAGGKTSAMFSLARQFEPPVIVGATAHLAIEQVKLADQNIIVQSISDVDTIMNGRLPGGVTLFTGPVDHRGRTSGLDGDCISQIKKYADEFACPMLIEADGARFLPLKAPADHEPPIPTWVNHVLVVAGLSALGKQLSDDIVFRSDIFSLISGIEIGSEITLSGLVRYLLEPNGGLKNIPEGVERSILFNQLDLIKEDIDWENHSDLLLSQFNRVILGVMKKESGLKGLVEKRFEKIAGIILAGGDSTRFGTPKQLISWHGKPLIRHVAERALAAGLRPTVVVIGAVVDPIRQVLEGLPVEIIENRDWQMGQSSSVHTGISVRSEQWGAAVFLMSDMPQVSIHLLKELIEIHQHEVIKIIVPRVNGQRTNPVLFDKSCFPSLKEITGDTGGRIIFDAFPIHWLDTNDSNLLLDIDTIEDYRRLMMMPLDKNE
jgi:molybdenum cofactor cytidylyltransferase